MLEVELSAGATVREAIERSGILQRFPEIDLMQNKVGRWNHLVTLDDVVSAGDRIEIYRPLLIDPKEVRRLRAARDRKGR
ncbi:MAG: RnfH family protein [Pseudomonadota bacterium]|nr:RnfH family protein [Pseudomonadota bacterium]